ncbi:MAG TPA: hypothetical protein VM452_05185 [Caulifigura sp.]|nr:hypothetical protein [Caulifigura sp.]
MQVRREVFGDVVVGGGQQEADPQPVGQAADAIGDHLRQGAVERGREFVGDQPFGKLGNAERQPEAVLLAVAEFGRAPEQQPGFTEAALGEELQGVRRREWNRVDEQLVAERQPVEIEDVLGAPEFVRGGAHQRRLSGPGRPGEQGNLAGLERKLQPVGNDVTALLEADTEVVHHAGSADGGRLRQEIVRNRKTHESVLMTLSSERDRLRSSSRGWKSSPGWGGGASSAGTSPERQSWRARQRFMASARSCWNFSAFSASVRADDLVTAGFSASGMGLRGREVTVIAPLERGAAGCFLEVLGIPTLCPFGAARDTPRLAECRGKTLFFGGPETGLAFETGLC